MSCGGAWHRSGTMLAQVSGMLMVSRMAISDVYTHGSSEICSDQTSMVFRSEASGVEVVVVMESMSVKTFWTRDLQTVKDFLDERLDWNLG